mmetsp:Transcript_16649/g.38850  ORF Transcript_16649/g.38850 Transcript_16649/m.38850 type:complete len:215 (-) Transcript_16649:307-951(-)
MDESRGRWGIRFLRLAFHSLRVAILRDVVEAHGASFEFRGVRRAGFGIAECRGDAAPLVRMDEDNGLQTLRKSNRRVCGRAAVRHELLGEMNGHDLCDVYARCLRPVGVLEVDGLDDFTLKLDGGLFATERLDGARGDLREPARFKLVNVRRVPLGSVLRSLAAPARDHVEYELASGVDVNLGILWPRIVLPSRDSHDNVGVVLRHRAKVAHGR